MKLKSSIAIISALVSQAGAATLALWTFETSVPATAGPFAAESGTVSTTAFATSNTGGTYSNPVGNGSPESFSSNGWNIGEYYQFTVDTTGEVDLIVTWDQTRSSSGPASFALQYSTDGTNFTTFSSYTVAAVTWAGGTPAVGSSYSADLSAVTAVENVATLTLRLVDTEAVDGASTGTNRVDNFMVATIPEPTVAALGALGLLGLLRRRR